jgi:hypothetical protein
MEFLMRIIPTSAALVDSMKKAAKKLQRKGGGKHTDLLDRVARQHGYRHWHHVVTCQEITADPSGGSRVNPTEVLLHACADAVRLAQAGESKMWVAPSDMFQNARLVVFTTTDGDAWLLEPNDELVMCLCWHGKARPYRIRDEGREVEMQWDGEFELRGAFFEVFTELPEIGSRLIAGYPTDALRKCLEETFTVERKIEQVILQTDSVPIDDQIIQHLVRTEDFSVEEIRKFQADGGRYSPSRDSVLFGPFTEVDLDGNEGG